jgi:hypothetical protein
MEMLCLMHEASPRGSLLVNGKPVTDRQLANLCGVPARDAAALLSELDEAGVFSRDEDGTIFSRRIRRDHAKAEEGRKQVSKRWSGGPENGPDPNRPPNRSDPPDPITQKPEARSQKEASTPAREADDAISISEKLLKSCGLEADAVEGFGLTHQVQAWRNASIPSDFLIATVLRIAKSYGSFPSLSYLIKAMQNEWRKACEQPEVKAENFHAKPAENHSVAAVLRGLERDFRSEGEAGAVCDDSGGLVPKGQLQ